MGNEQAKDFDQNYEEPEGAARRRLDSPNPGAARQRPANRISWEDSDDNIHPGVRDFGQDMREEWAQQQQAEDAAAAQERERLERVRWEAIQADLAARKNARDAADERKQWRRRMEADRAEERARDEAVKRSAREKKVEIEKRRRVKEEARRRAEEARRRRAAVEARRRAEETRRRRAAAAEEAKRKSAARQAENEGRRRAQERSAREAAAAREAARRRAEEARRRAEEARRRAGDGGGGGGGGLSEETRKQRAAFQRVRNLKTDEGVPVPGYSYLFEVVGGDGKTRAEQLAERMAQLSTRVVPGTTRYAPNDKRDRIAAARALLLLADVGDPDDKIKVGRSLQKLIAREVERGDEAKANKYRYHYLMKMWHPDRVKGGEEIKAAGESALIANNFAVRLLSDAHDVLKVGWAGKPLIKGGAKTRRRRRRNRKRRGKKTTRARRGRRQRKKTKKRRKRRKTKRRR